MKKIAVVTTTRAEYGLLRNVMKRIDADEELELCLLVTGTHLSAQYGNTIQEIKEDGFTIAQTVPILAEKEGIHGVLGTMSQALEKFGKVFERIKPSMLLVLGDRYELLSICESAFLQKIPIAHISGGEITEGAADDTIRHCITKMSQLHFPGCEEYRRRIIQLGEQPNRVFNYGDVGVENILKMDFVDRQELEKYMDFQLDKPYACVTFHPVTLANESPQEQIRELLAAIDTVRNMKFIFTGANADAGGASINQMIADYVKEHENCRMYASLGIRRYLSLLKGSEMIIGNSSSGIVEAPTLKIPTVNIGNRQGGRLQAKGIINCEPKREEIIEAMNQALTPEWKHLTRMAENPYGSGDTSEGIVREIKTYLHKEQSVIKKFYDILF